MSGCRYCGDPVKSGTGVNLGSPGPDEPDLYAHTSCVQSYDPEVYRDVMRNRRRKTSGPKRQRAPKNLPPAPPGPEVEAAELRRKAKKSDGFAREVMEREAERLDAFAEARARKAASQAGNRKGRVTSTGRLGGGGVVVPGRHRNRLLQVRMTDSQRDGVEKLRRRAEPFAPGGANVWNDSEYIRALVTLDGIGAVKWSKLASVVADAEEGGDDE